MRCTKLSIFYEHNFTSFSPRPSGCYGIPTPPTCRTFSCLIIIFTFNETLNWSDFDSTFLINGIHFGWLWLILRTSIRHVGQNVGAWKKSIVVARKNRIWKWWIWFDDTNGPSSAGDVVTFSLTSHYFHWHLNFSLFASFLPGEILGAPANIPIAINFQMKRKIFIATRAAEENTWLAINHVLDESI